MSSAISSTGSSSSSTSASAVNSLITSTGIGSGLNITEIVDALTESYGAAQTDELSSEKSTLQAQVSAFGTFQSALDTLQATLSSVDTASALAGYSATVADTTIASATTDSDAVPGTYSLEVQNLATAQSLASSAFADGSDSYVGTGTLTLAVGGQSTSIAIDSSNDTLSGIASAINSASANPGVEASVISTTAGARLVLTSTETGAANTITVTQSGGDGGLSQIAYDPAADVTGGLTQTQAGEDANFTINGYAATSASNQVSNAISGVTLDLTGASAAGTPTTVTIAADTSTASTSIGTFVSALNGVISAVQSLTSYDASTGEAGALNGNATLEEFQDQLENILDTVQSSNSGGINSLAQLGISADANTGQLDTDSTTLGNALSGSLSSVESLLGGTDGIATQLNTLINQYTGTGGLLSSINSGLQTSLTQVAQQQSALETELSSYSATLTQEYNAMDTAVAALKETQTYLTAEFDPSSSTSSGSSSSSSSSLSGGTLGT